jgi:Ca2+-binding RTX toxin-like protein
MVANDNFAERAILNGTSVSATGTNVGATSEPGEPFPSSPNQSVWWSWMAPTSGTVTFNTVGSNFDTELGIYTGSAVNSLTRVAFSDDAPQPSYEFYGPSEVTFQAEVGTTYQVAVNGFDRSEGLITLNIDLTSNSIVGTSGNDNLFGTVENDFIDGGSGNDQIFGSEGVNILWGGEGDDAIYGGSQRDVIRGGSGNDTIFASEGNNDVYGGDGNDTIYTGSGSDYIIGGSGNDTIWLGGGQDTVVLARDGGSDTINNFQHCQTHLALAAPNFTGLTFSDLTIAQGNNATLISITSTEELLATLVGVQASSVTATNFLTITSTI